MRKCISVDLKHSMIGVPVNVFSPYIGKYLISSGQLCHMLPYLLSTDLELLLSLFPCFSVIP